MKHKFPTIKRIPKLQTRLAAAGAVLLFCVVGYSALNFSSAAPAFVAAEPEQGTLTAGAISVSDTTASNGSLVKFQAPVPGARSCPPLPAFPDENCTGVPPGIVLKTNCPSTISTPNSTYDSCLWSNGLTITTYGVKITRSKVVGVVDMGYYANQVYNITFEDVEIDGNRTRGSAIDNVAFTGRRMKIHNAQILVWSNGPNLLLEDSYLYNLYGAELDHAGGITGTPLEGTIRHNTILGNLAPWAGPFTSVPGDQGGVSAAITAYTHGDFWPNMDGLLLENNQLQSVNAVYTAYAGGTGNPGEARNVRYINNVFKRIGPGRTSAMDGNITAFHSGYGNQIDGNKYDDGVAIPENSWDGDPQ